MKVLIVSDTHRNEEKFFSAIERETPVDMVVHCGDAEGNESIIREAAGCPVEIILGNNDFFSDLPREREFKIEKYNIWLTHGHNYYVSMGNELIKEEAKSRGADIVMYGHTHKPVIDVTDGIIAINPGSLTYPRQEGRKASYVVMEIDSDGEAHFKICYL